MVRLLAVPRGGHVLLLGCGTGAGLEPLLRHLAPRSLTAVDISSAEVVTAQARGLAARLVVGDATALPFRGGSFDVVIDFGTCHHVDEPVHAMREIARVLTPSGVLVHETALAQALAHPLRFRRRPSLMGPELVVLRRALLWAARRGR